MAKRTRKGTFAKGTSGNPGGRPKKVAEVLAEHRDAHLEEVLTRLLRISLKDRNTKTSVAASTEYLNRTIGKPAVAVHLTGAEGGPIKVSHGIDLKKLNNEQLEQLDAILAAGAAEPGDGSGGEGPT